MPLFDFKCTYCTEVIEINENIPPACTTCGETMQRVWSAPAVKFNGTGFYSTGGQMAHKKFNRFWLIYGKVSGFAIGFNVDKYSITVDLGFWYIGLEY